MTPRILPSANIYASVALSSLLLLLLLATSTAAEFSNRSNLRRGGPRQRTLRERPLRPRVRVDGHAESEWKEERLRQRTASRNANPVVRDRGNVGRSPPPLPPIDAVDTPNADTEAPDETENEETPGDNTDLVDNVEIVDNSPPLDDADGQDDEESLDDVEMPPPELPPPDLPPVEGTQPDTPPVDKTPGEGKSAGDIPDTEAPTVEIPAMEPIPESIESQDPQDKVDTPTQVDGEAPKGTEVARSEGIPKALIPASDPQDNVDTPTTVDGEAPLDQPPTTEQTAQDPQYVVDTPTNVDGGTPMSQKESVEEAFKGLGNNNQDGSGAGSLNDVSDMFESTNTAPNGNTMIEMGKSQGGSGSEAPQKAFDAAKHLPAQTNWEAEDDSDKVGTLYTPRIWKDPMDEEDTDPVVPLMSVGYRPMVCGRDLEKAQDSCSRLPICTYSKVLDPATGMERLELDANQGDCVRRCDSRYGLSEDHCGQHEYCFSFVPTCPCSEIDAEDCRPF